MEMVVLTFYSLAHLKPALFSLTLLKEECRSTFLLCLSHKRRFELLERVRSAGAMYSMFTALFLANLSNLAAHVKRKSSPLN